MIGERKYVSLGCFHYSHFYFEVKLPSDCYLVIPPVERINVKIEDIFLKSPDRVDLEAIFHLPLEGNQFLRVIVLTIVLITHFPLAE